MAVNTAENLREDIITEEFDMKKILLASGSPRRRELLKMLDVDFEVCVSDCDEKNNNTDGEYARCAAVIKAESVKDKGLGKIIVSADTIVCIDGLILGKPKDRADAEKMLDMLSGRVHFVYTGFCIIDGDKMSSGYEKTEVYFRTLSKADKEWYLDTGEWKDKAGGYGIQGRGALLTEKINGDFFNVVGLPVSRIFSEISKL